LTTETEKLYNRIRWKEWYYKNKDYRNKYMREYRKRAKMAYLTIEDKLPILKTATCKKCGKVKTKQYKLCGGDYCNTLIMQELKEKCKIDN
jgi:hypothetical protein